MEKRKDREDQSMYWKKACKLTAVLGLAVMLQIQTVSAGRHFRWRGKLLS